MGEYLNFSAGGIEFVIPSRDLRGVVEGPVLFPVPMVPAAVAGIFNWKGRPYTGLDPAAMAGGVCAAPHFALVLEHAEGDIALVAETVGNIFHVDSDDGIQPGDGPLFPAPAACGTGRKMVAVRALVEALKVEMGGACGPDA